MALSNIAWANTGIVQSLSQKMSVWFSRHALLSEVFGDGRPVPARPPTLRARVLLFFSTWTLALLMAAPWDKLKIQALPLIPMGLLIEVRALDQSMLFAGWLVYLGHALFYFLASKRWLYWAAYSVLVVLLITNVAGCQTIWKGFSEGA